MSQSGIIFLFLWAFSLIKIKCVHSCNLIPLSSTNQCFSPSWLQLQRSYIARVCCVCLGTWSSVIHVFWCFLPWVSICYCIPLALRPSKDFCRRGKVENHLVPSQTWTFWSYICQVRRSQALWRQMIWLSLGAVVTFPNQRELPWQFSFLRQQLNVRFWD